MHATRKRPKGDLPEDTELRPQPTPEPPHDELANGDDCPASRRIELRACLLGHSGVALVDGLLLLYEFRQSRRESGVEIRVHLSHHIVAMDGEMGAKRRF